MVAPAAKAVIWVQFPNLSQIKLGNAKVLLHAGRTDWIFCPISSNSYDDQLDVESGEVGFAHGSLRIVS